MTARRRRKSGSGPSATALIAWIGGARTGASDPAPVSVVGDEPAEEMAGGRAVLLGRACGLAAGTLLACGSVLASATHVGDGSLATDSASLLSRTPASPGATMGSPGELPADAPAEPAPAAPDLVSTQAVSDPNPVVAPRPRPVRRNPPVSVDMPIAAPQYPDTGQRPVTSPPPASRPAPAAPIVPIRPVLDPATQGVGRVAPVGGVLPPTKPSTERADTQSATPRDDQTFGRRDARTRLTTPGTLDTVNKAVTPLDNVIQLAMEPVLQPVIRQPLIQPATKPAMAMLTSLLPIG